MLRRLFRKHPPSPQGSNTEALIAFLPLLESGKLKRSVGYRRKHGRDKPEIEQLRDLLRNSPLVGGVAWVNPPVSLLRILMQKDLHQIETLPASSICTLLTLVSRHDRLAEGALLAAVCKTGIMPLLLKRLKTLHETGEIG